MTGATIDDYVDLREPHPEYREQDCERCGERTWFRLRNDSWACDDCAWSRSLSVLDRVCGCGHKMHVLRTGEGRTKWVCNWCDTRADENWEALADRLSSDVFPRAARKPGLLGGECPACGASNSVNGDPDGALICKECHDFYAGQYSTEWYGYAIWMESPKKIRVVGSLDDAQQQLATDGGTNSQNNDHEHLMGVHRTCPFCHSRLHDPDETFGHFLSKHEFRFEKANGLAKWMWEGDTEWDEEAMLEQFGMDEMREEIYG